MGKQLRYPASELDHESWSILSQLVSKFEDSWRTSPNTSLAEFVPNPQNPLRERTLIELIKVDQEYRWEAGTQKKLEDYLDEWPELCDKQETMRELIEAECVIRTELGTPSVVEELQDRFPDIADEIDLSAIFSEAARSKAPRRSSSQANPDGESSNCGDNTTPNGERQQTLTVGETFGRYEIRALLGRGGMGTVYRAYDPKLDREVALKIPQFSDREVLKRFVREANAAAKIWHPNICPIYDVGDIDGVEFITMALVDGQPLSERIKSHKLDTNHIESEKLEPEEAAELVRKLADALIAVHAKGVVHRDITPSNVMIRDSGEPLLMDFGVARQIVERIELSEADISQAGNSRTDVEISLGDSFLGTPLYMSPEQVTGQPVDERSDLYMLGVLFFQLLTGRLPFGGSLDLLLTDIRESQPPKPRDFQTDLPLQLETICLKAMAKNPDERYRSAEELSNALQDYLPQLPPKPISQRWPWRTILAGSIVTVATVVMAWVLIYFKTGYGTLTLHGIHETDIYISINKDKDDEFDYWDGKPIKLPVGRHKIIVKPDHEDAIKFVSEVDITWRGSEVKLPVKFQPNGKWIPINHWIETKYPVQVFCLSGDGKNLFLMSTVQPLANDDLSQEKKEGGHKKPKNARSILYKHIIDKNRSEAIVEIRYPLDEKTQENDEQGRSDFKGIALSRDDNFLFATDYYHSHVVKIDLSKSSQIVNVDDLQKKDIFSEKTEDGEFAQELRVSPDGKHLVIPTGEDGQLRRNNHCVALLKIEDGKLIFVLSEKLPGEPRGYHIGFGPCSKDGNEITRYAYVITKKKLLRISLTNLDNEKIIEVFHPDFGELTDITIDPVTNRAFLNDAAQRKIHKIDLNKFSDKSVKPTEIESQDGIEILAFDPNKSLLAGLAPAFRTLFLLDPKEGTVLGEVTGFREGASDLEFSQDGNAVYVSHSSPKGGVAVISTGDIRKSPYEYSIVFASNRNNRHYEIFRRDGNGEPYQLTFGRGKETNRAPRWSPDGKKIAFVSTRNGTDIHIMDANGDNRTPLELGNDRDFLGNVQKPSFVKKPISPGSIQSGVLDWSPDGTKIVFIHKGEKGDEIRTVDVKTGAIEIIIDWRVEFNRQDNKKYTDKKSGKQIYDLHWGLRWWKTNQILFNSVNEKNGWNQDILAVDVNAKKVKQKSEKIEQLTHAWEEEVLQDGKKKVVYVYFFAPAPEPRKQKTEPSENENRTIIALQKKYPLHGTQFVMLKKDRSKPEIITDNDGTEYMTPEWLSIPGKENQIVYAAKAKDETYYRIFKMSFKVKDKEQDKKAVPVPFTKKPGKFHDIEPDVFVPPTLKSPQSPPSAPRKKKQ